MSQEPSLYPLQFTWDMMVALELLEISVLLEQPRGQSSHTLDPARISAAVTREVADRLAALGRSFEGQGHDSEEVARFLMRCLFTMFAEDLELIPRASFSDLLKKLRGHPQNAAPALAGLWDTIEEASGTVS